MRNRNTKYILGIITACLPGLTGCTDDVLYEDNTMSLSSDYVAFSAGIGVSSSIDTRSERPLYEPLVLGSDREDYPLYLHTYEHAAGDDYIAAEETATRGLQIESSQALYDIHKTFSVRGGMEADGADYIPATQAKCVSTSDYSIWTTSTPQRWIGNERIAFNAIAPYSALNTISDPIYGNNSISFSYTARKGTGDNDAEMQTDLMMATATMNREETADYNYRVPLRFHHALSAVKFAVRDVIAGKIVSVSIKGVKGTGKCLYTADPDSRNGKFEWTDQSGSETYTQVFNKEIGNGNFDPNDETQDVLLTKDMPEKTFMLIPQELTEDAEIEVVVERYNLAPGLEPTITVRGKILANDVKEWKPGHEYIYTISTSKDNWVYVLQATGNHSSETNDPNHNVDGDQIYVYSPSDEKWDTYGNNAYFKVKSYRYKANDQTYIEALPWKASHEGSYSYNVDGGTDKAYPEGKESLKFVEPLKWITDKNSQNFLKGSGTSTKDETDRHDLTFLPHYVSTTWKGDEWMQGYEPYSGFDKDTPYDLSTYGGARSRTTANCYVIDRGGWYMLPLVYGNAVVEGKDNKSSYTSESPLKGKAGYNILDKMKDYMNQEITSSYIKNVNVNCRAVLVWQDAYSMVENVELVWLNTIQGSEPMIRFWVDRNNLQQGNAIVALTDRENGKIMWSWHIWATEHWLDVNTRLPHVYDDANPNFTSFKANAITGIREKGDVSVTHNQGNNSFMMSPYNLGWCDPKKVLYLKRKNVMKYVQYMPDGETPTKHEVSLPIIQDGSVIDYKFANNTYYQWGRKDPMRGYFNHDSATKRVFGKLPSSIGNQGAISIGDAIQTPQIFYGNTGTSATAYEDWLEKDGFLNLWNNHRDIGGDRKYGIDVLPNANEHKNQWVHTKTIYDPSPSGYMVPNSGVWHFIHKEFNDTIVSWHGGEVSRTNFDKSLNGKFINNYDYKVWGNGVEGDNNAIFFSATGNCWWTSDEGGTGGDNFGNTTSYAWSNRSIITNNGKREAFGMALGLQSEKPMMLYIGGQFLGRRAMARPVRAIREPAP